MEKAFFELAKEGKSGKRERSFTKEGFARLIDR